jgi:hypothetical protein
MSIARNRIEFEDEIEEERSLASWKTESEQDGRSKPCYVTAFLSKTDR